MTSIDVFGAPVLLGGIAMVLVWSSRRRRRHVARLAQIEASAHFLSAQIEAFTKIARPDVPLAVLELAVRFAKMIADVDFPEKVRDIVKRNPDAFAPSPVDAEGRRKWTQIEAMAPEETGLLLTGMIDGFRALILLYPDRASVFADLLTHIAVSPVDSAEMLAKATRQARAYDSSAFAAA